MEQGFELPWLGPSHASLYSINSPKNRLFYSGRIVWEAKLHSTDAGDVPTPQFKRGAVQEMYSPGDGIHQRRRHQQRLEKQTVRHANQVAHSKEQG